MVDEKNEVKYKEVAVIRSDEKSALVEYVDNDGHTQRVTVAAKSVEEKGVKDSALKKGIPFGIDWTELNYPAVTPQMINDELHRHDIWTRDDVRSKPAQLRAAIMSVQGPLIGIIMKYINEI